MYQISANEVNKSNKITGLVQAIEGSIYNRELQ